MKYDCVPVPCNIKYTKELDLCVDVHAQSKRNPAITKQQIALTSQIPTEKQHDNVEEYSTESGHFTCPASIIYTLPWLLHRSVSCHPTWRYFLNLNAPFKDFSGWSLDELN